MEWRNEFLPHCRLRPQPTYYFGYSGFLHVTVRGFTGVFGDGRIFPLLCVSGMSSHSPFLVLY